MDEFQDALNNIKSMKDTTSHDTFMSMAKRTIKGSAIGAVAGLMYAWYYQKNLYVFGFMGAIGGGAINYFLIGDTK
jgi:hypothetical protein